MLRLVDEWWSGWFCKQFECQFGASNVLLGDCTPHYQIMQSPLGPC